MEKMDRKERTILGNLERAKRLLEYPGKHYVIIERSCARVTIATIDEDGKYLGKNVTVNTFNHHYKKVFPNLSPIKKHTKYILTPSSFFSNEFASVEKMR